MTDKTPNPGSPEAIDQGCTCPVMDNANGRGAWGSGGDNAVFWMSRSCIVHNPLQSKESKDAAAELTRQAQDLDMGY